MSSDSDNLDPVRDTIGERLQSEEVKAFSLAEAATDVVEKIREQAVKDLMGVELPDGVTADGRAVIISSLMKSVEAILKFELGEDFIALEEYQRVTAQLAAKSEQLEAARAGLKRSRDEAAEDETGVASAKVRRVVPVISEGSATDIDEATRMRLLSARRPWLHLDWWMRTPLTSGLIRAVMGGFDEYVEKAGGPEKYAMETTVRTVRAHMEACAEKKVRPDMAVVRPLYDRAFVLYQAEVGLVGRTTKGARAAAVAAGAARLGDVQEGIPEAYKDIRKVMNETAAAVTLSPMQAHAKGLAALHGGAGAYGLNTNPPGAPRGGGAGGRPRGFRGNCRACGDWGHMGWQCPRRGSADGTDTAGGRGNGQADGGRGNGGGRGGGGRGGGAGDGTG